MTAPDDAMAVVRALANTEPLKRWQVGMSLLITRSECWYCGARHEGEEQRFRHKRTCLWLRAHRLVEREAAK